jgi:hypothetical protein
LTLSRLNSATPQEHLQVTSIEDDAPANPMVGKASLSDPPPQRELGHA